VVPRPDLLMQELNYRASKSALPSEGPKGTTPCLPVRVPHRRHDLKLPTKGGQIVDSRRIE
jgi:hypothetical protein